MKMPMKRVSTRHGVGIETADGKEFLFLPYKDEDYESIGECGLCDTDHKARIIIDALNAGWKP